MAATMRQVQKLVNRNRYEHQFVSANSRSNMSKASLPERLKTSWVGKAGDYIKNVLRDYKAATVDIFTDARDGPIKAVIYAAGFCFAAVAAWSNPDEKSYYKSLREASNDLLLLSDPIRNPVSDEHVQCVLRLRNENRIRRMNLVVCSVIWRDDYGAALGLYDSQCEYLRPGWRDFNTRILDVGFMNRWYYLNRAMVDHDVNDVEFKKPKS